MKKKLVLYLILPACLIMVLGVGVVHANTSYEGWSANINYNWIGLDWQKKTSSTSKRMYLNWRDAEARDFKLYFRILNESMNTVQGSFSVEYLGSTNFDIPTVSGREYLLQGSRQYMWDPKVYCKGDWKIN